MSAPVPNLPPPSPNIGLGGGTAGAETGCVGGKVGFTSPTLQLVLPCGLGFSLPPFFFGLTIPPFSLAFFLKLPSLFLNLKINCDLSNPIDVTGGVTPPALGGRITACNPDPDDFEAAA